MPKLQIRNWGDRKEQLLRQVFLWAQRVLGGPWFPKDLPVSGDQSLARTHRAWGLTEVAWATALQGMSQWQKGYRGSRSVQSSFFFFFPVFFETGLLFLYLWFIKLLWNSHISQFYVLVFCSCICHISSDIGDIFVLDVTCSEIQNTERFSNLSKAS